MSRTRAPLARTTLSYIRDEDCEAVLTSSGMLTTCSSCRLRAGSSRESGSQIPGWRGRRIKSSASRTDLSRRCCDSDDESPPWICSRDSEFDGDGQKSAATTRMASDCMIKAVEERVSQKGMDVRLKDETIGPPFANTLQTERERFGLGFKRFCANWPKQNCQVVPNAQLEPSSGTAFCTGGCCCSKCGSSNIARSRPRSDPT